MEDKNKTKFVHECKQKFPEGFTFVAYFCYELKLLLIHYKIKVSKVSSKVKVSSLYFKLNSLLYFPRSRNICHFFK